MKPFEHSEDSLTLDVIDGILERFKQDVLRSRFAHPEEILSSQAFEEILTQAKWLGLISIGTGEGVGLWEEPKEMLGMSIALRVLSALAEINVSVPFHLHLLGLGGYLKRRLGLQQTAWAVPFLQGGNGLARGALARFLFGYPLQTDDIRLLTDYFPGGKGIYQLQVGEGWEELIAPCFLEDFQTLEWRIYHRSDLNFKPAGPTHGLDETGLFEVDFSQSQQPNETVYPSLQDSRQILIEILGLHALAMIALGLGSVEGAYQKAKTYALNRIQGGQAIALHAGVQLMLGEIVSMTGLVRHWLLKSWFFPSQPKDLAEIFQARAIIHPLLCKAANEALQILGGYGYMKDYGLEKVVRDNNQLKVSFGSPQDIFLFLATQEIEQNAPRILRP